MNISASLSWLSSRPSSRFSSRSSSRSNLSLRQTGSKAPGFFSKALRSVAISTISAVIILILFLTTPLLAQPAPQPTPVKGALAPYDLRVEYLANPLGVDVAKPRFFWKNRHSERGQSQTAFELIVSSSPSADTGDLWESGKTSGDSSIQIVYGGKPLASNHTYYWKVRARDSRQAVGEWSEVFSFTTP